MFEPIMPNAKASALTNFLQLDESPKQAACKMLDFLSTHETQWQPDSVTLDKYQAKNPAVLINNIKREIAADIGNGVRAASIPFFQNSTNRQQYFYLRPGQSNRPVKSPLVEPSVVLRLGVIAALLGETEFGARKLQADTIGPKIYVGTRSFKTKKNVSGIEMFRLDLEFCHDQLQIVLVAQSMNVEANAMVSGPVTQHEVGDRGLTLSLISADRFKKWDGRKTKLPDITFNDKDIRGSRLYLLNRLTEFFSDVFTRAGIAHSRVVFGPTHVTSEPHLRLDAIAKVPRELTIINNTGTSLTAIDQSSIIEALSRDGVQFDAFNFLNDGSPTNDSTWVETLNPDDAWLVLNRTSSDDNDTSIRVEDDSLKRPWDAYHALANDAASQEDVDAYTWAKFSKLYQRERRNRVAYPVMQGIDITAGNGIDIDDQREAFRRCAVELAIKHCFAAGEIPLSPLTPEGTFTLLFVDKVFLLESGEYRKPLVYLAGAKIVIAGGRLKIIDRFFHPEIGLELAEELRSKYPCLGKYFQGDSMYVIDESSGRFLRRFTGSIVPKIILNSRYASINDALATMANNGGLINGCYSRARNWALLPFYVAPPETIAENIRWRNTSFVEDKGNYVRYFVPSQLAPKASCGFSNLHDLMVFVPEPIGDTGQIKHTIVESNLLDEPLVQLYLSTLTTGIMRLNENSKASLLEKIASLAGMDT